MGGSVITHGTIVTMCDRVVELVISLSNVITVPFMPITTAVLCDKLSPNLPVGYTVDAWQLTPRVTRDQTIATHTNAKLLVLRYKVFVDPTFKYVTRPDATQLQTRIVGGTARHKPSLFLFFILLQPMSYNPCLLKNNRPTKSTKHYKNCLCDTTRNK